MSDLLTDLRESARIIEDALGINESATLQYKAADYIESLQQQLERVKEDNAGLLAQVDADVFAENNKSIDGITSACADARRVARKSVTDRSGVWGRAQEKQGNE